jgi:hypothetical protein
MTFLRVVLASLVVGCVAEIPPPCAGLRSQVVLVGLFTHDRPMTDRGVMFAPGVDLDDHVDDGDDTSCTAEPDFVSTISAENGVDNQYAVTLLQLLEMDDPRGMTQLVAAQLATGDILYALEIDASAGVTPEVTLLRVDATAPLTVDTTGTLEGGQSFTVVSRASAMPLCLPGGDLEAVLPMLELPLGPALLSRPVGDVHFRLVVDDDGLVRRGELGASVAFSTVMTVFETLAPELASETIVRGVTHFDLDPSPSGQCDAVSLGLGLVLVPATIVP